jgi:uncharacterized protein
MIRRSLETILEESLRKFPVAGLIGSRQVGKTTLAKKLLRDLPLKSVYLDLERPSDLAKLGEPELYLESHCDSLVILDEIQRKPDLSPLIRSLVDSDRRPGRFLILGSASPHLIRQSSESLAGRIVYHELPPLSLSEIGFDRDNTNKIWVRGGYPNSLLAQTEEDSIEWREAFIQTHLERDIPNLGVRTPAHTLRRFWTMLAHFHGQLWNASKVAASLGVSAPSVRNYLDVLQDTFMVRQLPPHHPNVKKRLVKSPKYYLRDSGILHSLLGIRNRDDLLGHPSAGASWEGCAIEQILSLVPRDWRSAFYRTSAGAEIDLLVQAPGRTPPLAVEIKLSLEPKPSRGFWSALSDLGEARGFVVYPGDEFYPVGKGVYALPVQQLDRVFRGR